MKRVLLICPDARPAMDAVSGGLPLALATYLGKPLIEHALDGLAAMGVTHVRLLASDRPSEVRAYVGSGSAWGIQTEIYPEASELTPQAAFDRHAGFRADKVWTLDRLPQAPGTPILQNCEAWHASRETLLPLLAPRQLGAREMAPGIWCGLKARVDSSATLSAPCWIGPNSIVRAGAIVGPGAFVESDSLVDAHAEIVQSTVGSRTYLGSMTNLHDSIAAGASLIKWRTGSEARLTDAFLLSRLDPPTEAASALPLRIVALLLLLLTAPMPLFAWLLGCLFRKPWLSRHIAALPSEAGSPGRCVGYYDFPSLPGHLARWPWLWRIVTGHFGWIGNPPLTPEEAARLEGEFERLWIQAAPAIFTAPEAEGCKAPWDDAARAHAALYACQPSFAWQRRILLHGLKHVAS